MLLDGQRPSSQPSVLGTWSHSYATAWYSTKGNSSSGRSTSHPPNPTNHTKRRSPKTPHPQVLTISRERQRKKQITDIAIRFIQAVSKQSTESMNLKETLAELKSSLEKALQDDNPLEAIAKLTGQGSDPENLKDMFKDAGAQVNAAGSLLEGMSAAEPALSELNVLVAEMRLIVPNDIVHIAEQVSTVCFLPKSSSCVSVLPLQMRLALGSMVTSALNVFVNAVRHEVGQDYYVPEVVQLKDVGKVFQELADKQTNEAHS